MIAPQAMEAKLLSIVDACRVLGGVSAWTLRKHISRHNVRTVHLGQRVFIRVEEIERIRREGLPSLKSPEPHHAHS